jgi:tetratricopeptide (TPR) repeat protein
MLRLPAKLADPISGGRKQANSVGRSISVSGLCARVARVSAEGPSAYHARDEFELGVAAQERDDHATAATHFEAAATANPHEHRYRLHLGESLARLERFDEAKEIYRKILKTNPEHLGALIGMGQLAERRGKARAADKFFGRAAEAAQDDPQRLLRLGMALQKLGKWEGAERAYRQVVASSDSDAQLRASKALRAVARLRGDGIAQEKDFEAILAAHPGDVERKLQVAEGLCRSHPDWNKRSLPKFSGAPRAETGPIDRADTLLHEVVEASVGPTRARALLDLAEIARFRRAWQDAVELLQRAVADDPGDARIRSEFGNALRDASRLDEAKSEYTLALEIDPHNVTALLGLCDIAQAENDAAGALALAERAAAVAPSAPLVMKALRKLQAQRGAYDWKEEIHRAIAVVNDENAPAAELFQAASQLLEYGLTGALKPAIPRLEKLSPQARQLLATARELERAGFAQTLNAEGTAPEGEDLDLNEVRGFIEKPNPGSDVLLVAFAGSNSRVAITFSLLHRYLRTTGANLVYVRDIQETRYLRGIVGLGDDFASTADAIRELADRAGAKRILMLGNCEGCAGALRYGAAVDAQAVLAVSPNIGVPASQVLKPMDSGKVDRIRAAYPGLLDVPALYRTAGEKPRVTLIFGEKDEPDDSRVRELANVPGVASAGIAQHRFPILRILLTEGLLQPMLQEFVANGVVSEALLDKVRRANG